MIKSMHVSGLKSLFDVRVDFNKLNILSGINSSGKSTLIQAIRMMMAAIDGKLGTLEHYGSIEELLFKKQSPNSYLTSPENISISIDCIDKTYVWETEDVDDDNDEPVKSAILYDIVTESNANNLDDKLLNRCCYNFLSAARFGPQPYLPIESEKGMFFLGENGEFVCDCLDRYKDLEIDNVLQHPNSEGRTLEYNVSAWLSDIVSGASVSVRKEKLFDLANITYNGYRPYNVGFGLSYTLPVVVGLLGMAAFSQKHSCDNLLIIENPEAHIHPQGQTKLGYLLGLASMAGLQIIVETHSDYIIDGVRLAIKMGIELVDERIYVDPASVNFLFFRLDEDGCSQIDTIIVNKNGKLDKWPQGFFDQNRKNKSKLAGI